MSLEYYMKIFMYQFIVRKYYKQSKNARYFYSILFDFIIDIFFNVMNILNFMCIVDLLTQT